MTIQDIARRLQAEKHIHTKEQHKRILSRTCIGKCDLKVIDDRKIVPSMVLR